MSPQASPFTYHHARWTQALKNLPQAEAEARQAAVEHIQAQVHAAARKAGLDTAPVSVSWDEGRPQLKIDPGPTADAEYGTLDTSPTAVLRNAAHRAEPAAVSLYHQTIQKRTGL